MKVNLRKACKKCGTWVCVSCGWERHGANRGYDRHDCRACGGTWGRWLPVTHRKALKHVTVELHGRVYEF